MQQGARAQEYVHEARYMACWDRDLGDSPRGVTILGEPIALYRAGGVIIEAQRRVLAQFPDRKMLPLNMDKAVLKYEGVLRKLRAGHA